MPVTVLVIDPDGTNSRWIASALASTDYVVEFLEGRKALFALMPAAPATCLVAFTEPDTDATLQLVREVRQHTSELPVLVLGLYSAFRTAVDIARLPGTDFLELPVSSRQLRTAIAKALASLPTANHQAEGHAMPREGD